MDSNGSTTVCTDLADAHLERVPNTRMAITPAGRFTMPIQLVRPEGQLVCSLGLVLTADQILELSGEIDGLLSDAANTPDAVTSESAR